MNVGILAFCILICFYGCRQQDSIVLPPSYFPQDLAPFFDSTSKDAIRLGRLLFFDKRLSINNSISCSSCHRPELAFTDGRKTSLGIFGRTSKRNAPTILNIGYSHTFMFDMAARKLELQPSIPILDSNEMQSSYDSIVKKLENEKEIQSLSLSAYGKKLDGHLINLSLAAFMRSLISQNSVYDSFKKTQDSSVFSTIEWTGYQLFFGKASCYKCHPDPLFTDFQHYDIAVEDKNSNDLGLYRISDNKEDIYRFKTPTLRNIEITHPYFHTGAVSSLEDALNYHLSPNRKTRDYSPSTLTADEKKYLLAFLKTLTDQNLKINSSLRIK